MELSINDGEESVGKYVQSVTYMLHPTYPKSVIKVLEPPFRIQRLAWGYFDVTMKICFWNKYKQEEVNLVHNLCFSNSGLKNSVLLEIEDDSKSIFTDTEADQKLVESIATFIKSKGEHDIDNN